MEDNIIEEKNKIISSKCLTPKLKKANKIHLELLSFTKDEIERKTKNVIKSFSISKLGESEKKEEKKENNDNVNDEQSSNIIINSNNSDTDDSDIESSDMSGCEEEILL